MSTAYPVLFVGSAVEDLPIDEAIQQRLEHYAEVEIWTEGSFVPSGSALPSLLATAKRVDFALFIASAIDVVSMRGGPFNVMRDNVLFEAGLFFGALGGDRVFVLVDRAQVLTLPSDLAGLTPLTMDTRKQNPQSIVGAACSELKSAMSTLGSRESDTQ